MTIATLLIEIGTEELPPKHLTQLSSAFADSIKTFLTQAHLTFGAIQAFSTPRRLAVLVEDVPERQNDSEQTRKGPAVSAAFNEQNQPTPAALGFAKSCGVPVDSLSRITLEGETYLALKQHLKGKSLQTILQEQFARILQSLPAAKKMRWGSFNETFIRPIHWLCVLHGKTILPITWMNITASNQTFGHRFHHPQAIILPDAKNYPAQLLEARVMVDPAARKRRIETQIKSLAESKHATAIVPPDLLEEVTQIVEWPNALMGHFNASLLKVPSAALITSMQHHQKSFALQTEDGSLLPHFILVSNVQPNDPSAILAGNERVMNARLNDAKFFFETDLKTPLHEHNKRLRDVIYQKKLGSVYEKVQRISKLAEKIALLLNVDPHKIEKAALLCKADLMTEMVGEFPELQGFMGQAYATLEGMPKETCAALEEIYRPRFAGDRLPQTTMGLILSLADRLDTLVGIFSIGGAPTGDKDPFGIRRNAIAILRLLIEKEHSIDLYALLNEAREGYSQDIDADVLPEILAFIQERLKSWLYDKGYDFKVIDAVISLHPTDPYDAYLRIQAVKDFMSLPQAESLCAANKRVRNILTKSEDALVRSPDAINPSFLVEEAERTLANCIAELAQQVTPLLEQQNYAAALGLLAGLKAPIDNFFDEVMVMADDLKIRNNRITLLNHLYRSFKQIADISRL
ncbi:MAG: glycine--tRNA ligase subunit beta [Gammaproteobacteria bacterium]